MKNKRKVVTVNNIDANQAYYSRKLAHYNEWLLSFKFGEQYPGFPEDNVPEKKGRPQRNAAKKTERRSADLSGKMSKKDQAIEIVRKIVDKEKSIKAIVKQLGMTTAGATTYYYNSKKALGL